MFRVKRLQREEIREQFAKEGVILLPSFLQEKEVRSLRQVAEELLRRSEPPLESEAAFLGEARQPYLGTIRRLRQIYGRNPRIDAWMRSEAIRPLLREILGSDPVLVTAHHNSLMTKMPHSSTETRWHRDRRYWSYKDDRLLSVWLALGEERVENGVLEFIPGSHRQEFPPEAFDEGPYFREDYPPNRPWIEKKIRFDLEPGDVVLFHCGVLHRAGPNRTETPKLSLVHTYRAADNLPLSGSRSAEYPEIPL